MRLFIWVITSLLSLWCVAVCCRDPSGRPVAIVLFWSGELSLPLILGLLESRWVHPSRLGLRGILIMGKRKERKNVSVLYCVTSVTRGSDGRNSHYCPCNLKSIRTLSKYGRYLEIEIIDTFVHSSTTKIIDDRSSSDHSGGLQSFFYVIISSRDEKKNPETRRDTCVYVRWWWNALIRNNSRSH